MEVFDAALLHNRIHNRYDRGLKQVTAIWADHWPDPFGRMQFFRAWLVDARAVRAIDGASQSGNNPVALTFDRFDIAHSAPVFGVLKLGTTNTIAAVDDATERAYQHRRFATRYCDHLAIKIGVHVRDCGGIVH